ncbi:MAG: hypothetical protein K6C11_00685 [Bacilli bacterium]|nr:hypothetical protein [Bacilli bacterium]
MEKIINTLKKVKVRYYVAALLVVIAVVGIAIFKPSYSVPTSLLDDQVLDGLTLTDISLTEDDGVTTYQATVTATENKTVNYIEIVLKDTEKDQAITLIGYVGKTLANGETSIIKASTDADVIHSTEVTYTVK